MNEPEESDVDWSLTTWEGARREQMRRLAELPPENVIAAFEDMLEIYEALHPNGRATE